MIGSSNTFVVLFSVVSIAFGASNRVQADNDPYPMFDIPIVANGYNIEQFINEPKGTKSAKYLLKADYPGPEILEFYDRRFKEMGYLPALDSAFGERKWERFVYETEKVDSVDRQLLSLWTNRELQAEVLLVLVYEETRKSRGGELSVFCQIQPIVDIGRLEAFFSRFEPSEQYVSFMELLDRYRMPNGDIDFDRAIGENPNNEYLKEYKSIVHEMNRQWKSKGSRLRN